jgi:hypothetical protein
MSPRQIFVYVLTVRHSYCCMQLGYCAIDCRRLFPLNNAGCRSTARRSASPSLVAVGCVRRREQYCKFTPGLHDVALASIASAVYRLKHVSPWQVGLKIFDIRSVIPNPLSVSTMLKLGGNGCLWLASTSKFSLPWMHEFTRSTLAK